MESSQFSVSQPQFEAMEPVGKSGATCDTFRVKVYGKLHFLKRLKPEYASDIRYQEAQRKEFETGYRLEHPNIVRYISLSDDGILMEYVDGETLTQRLADHPDYFKSRKNVDKFLRQLLDALGYLHGHQVLHLDLKPDNILLTCINDDVKLIDLGFCYTDTFADTRGHTAHFAAPEQLQGGTVDARTDIYALGKILDALPAHARYNKVIARCTAQKPEDRYQVISDLQQALHTKRVHWLWPFVAIFLVALSLGYYFSTQREQPPTEIAKPQIESKPKRTDTVVVREKVKPAEARKRSDEMQQEKSPVALGPIKAELSEEEKEFLNQPDLRILDEEEFTRYKRQLDAYYREVNDFLNDTANLRKYPSHHSYSKHYREIIERTREQMAADEWFWPLYNSHMNPVSSYTRKYKAALEHREFENSNKLP